MKVVEYTIAVTADERICDPNVLHQRCESLISAAPIEQAFRGLVKNPVVRVTMRETSN